MDYNSKGYMATSDIVSESGAPRGIREISDEEALEALPGLHAEFWRKVRAGEISLDTQPCPNVKDR